ncbi:MAG TPA: serine protease [Pyrinomonadaceae bacterium]|nr:serine protease [Pyrinomonadaceae bacterium]
MTNHFSTTVGAKCLCLIKQHIFPYLKANLAVLILVLCVFVSAPSFNIKAQDLAQAKTAVVRIKNNDKQETGTGFILKIEGDVAYIITAAHVIRGEQNPLVFLFTQQRNGLRADTLHIEDDDVKGLALLTVKLPGTAGVSALSLGPTSRFDGGEDVKVIGFPGTDLWTVAGGTVSRIDGRNLVFSAGIRGGNSGGPVISNGKVIGIVTDVIINNNQASAFAARSEAIEPYVNGLKPNLIPIISAVVPNTLCSALDTLMEESKEGFAGIVGLPTSSDNTFSPNFLIPGASNGYVTPPKRVYYYLLTSTRKGEVESQFYAAVTKVRRCSTQWEQKEESDSSYRYQKFRKTVGGVVVSVYYNAVPQHNTHFLMLDLSVPTRDRREW